MCVIMMQHHHTAVLKVYCKTQAGSFCMLSPNHLFGYSRQKRLCNPVKGNAQCCLSSGCESRGNASCICMKPFVTAEQHSFDAIFLDTPARLPAAYLGGKKKSRHKQTLHRSRRCSAAVSGAPLQHGDEAA